MVGVETVLQSPRCRGGKKAHTIKPWPFPWPGQWESQDIRYLSCPKLNSTQLHPRCLPAPWRVSPPLAGSGFPALFGLNYFFELWSHYFWIVIWSGRLYFHGFLLFSFLFTLLDVLPNASFYSSFWVVFITSMHLNLSREKLQDHCHLPPGLWLFGCYGRSSIF